VPVTIPALEAAPEPSPAPPPPPVAIAPAPVVPAPVVPAPVPAPIAPALPPPRNDAVVMMGVGFGVGAAGLIVGTLTGVVVLSQASTIRGQCNTTTNVCGSSQQGSLSSANTLANVSNVSIGLGVAGAGVGVIGLLLRSKDQGARTGLSITPIVGPTAVGLRGSF
jgi:hypothetical protein